MSIDQANELNVDRKKSGINAAISPAPSTDHISATAQRELSPFNSVWLWFTSLSTFVLSLVSDIFGPSLDPWLHWSVVLLLVAAVPLAIMLVGRLPQAGSQHPAGWTACLSTGARRCWASKRYGALLLSVAAFAVYSAYVKTKSEGYGPLRELLVSSLTVEEITRRTEASVGRVEVNTQVLIEKTSRIESEISRPLTAREQLAKEGVLWEATSYHQALERGDIEVLDAMLQAGWDVRSIVPDGQGHSLGHLFGHTVAHDKTVDTIKALKPYIDLTHTQIRIGQLPPARPATIAAVLCNRTMVEALNKAGVNVRIQDASWEAVKVLKNSSPFSLFPCMEADRDAILKLIEPALFQ